MRVHLIEISMRIRFFLDLRREIKYMSVLAMTLPIPEGKLDALENHIAEAKQRDDFEDTLRGFGLTHESWHVQSTPARRTTDYGF